MRLFGVCRAEVGVSALRLQQILGEIVPAERQRAVCRRGDAERVGDALDLPAHTGVIRERRGEVVPFDLCRAAVKGGDVCGRGVDRFAKVRAALGREHARRALEHGGLGHGVVGRAGVQLAHADEHRLDRRGHARDDGLERDDELACDIERIHAELRRGDVRAFAVDADDKVVDARVVGPRLDADGPRGKVGRRVQPEDALCAIQHARGDERPCALTDLLGGLEEEAHLTAKVRAVCAQNLCRAEKTRRVRVVAAGVHHARRLRAVGHVVRLLNG